jgi:hypothetical protein
MMQIANLETDYNLVITRTMLLQRHDEDDENRTRNQNQ